MQRSISAAIFAAALVSTALAQNTPAPCFESNLGANLGLGDDQVSQGNALGFTFTGPGNTSVTAIDISSNGFIWLGSSQDSGCCNGDLQGFLTGLPRIAPVWMDLYPPGGAGVFFNTFAATPTSLARAVVTWSQLPEYGTASPLFTVQLQLLSDGSFTFTYDTAVGNQFHNVLIGCTEGTAAIANPVDYLSITTIAPHLSGTNPTIHEEQTSAFDIAGGSYEFIPNGTGGYIVIDRPGCVVIPARATTFGRGCPLPAVAYELFTATNLIDLSNTAIDVVGNTTSGYVAIPTTGFFTPVSAPIASGDDVVTGPFTLPFTFAFPGGSTNQIDISSNGFLWLSTGNFNSRCCSGDPFSFLADGPSLAALWQDLNPNQGGSIHFDVDPNNTEVHITWLNVAEFASPGTTNTCQITLRSDGSFRLSYGAVANVQHDCLVGFSQGNGALDPGSRDFSALPFTMGAGGVPLVLDSQLGSLPVIGTTYMMELSSFPANSTFGIMVFGFGQLLPGLDLAAFGMPGCNQHVSLDATQFFFLTGNPTPFGFPIPLDTGLIGVLINAQGLSLSPGANALGALTSNGIEMLIGQ